MSASVAQITVSTRKELYGRKVRKIEKVGGTIRRGIVVDSQFIGDDQTGLKEMKTVLIVEDEETGLLLTWVLPCMENVEDWRKWSYMICFDKLDVDQTDIAQFFGDDSQVSQSAIGVGDLMSAVSKFRQNSEFDKTMAKGRVR